MTLAKPPITAAAVGAIVPAAGSSRRMGDGVNKLYVAVAGRPVLAYTLLALQSAADLGIKLIVVALAAGDVELFEQSVRPHLQEQPVVRVVIGGASRQQSVRRALAALPGDLDLVIVHDGARPFVTRSLLARCVAAAAGSKCVAAALPVTDTIKIAAFEADAAAGGVERVQQTPDRKRLRAVQTPQVFPAALLRRAHSQVAAMNTPPATDDAAMIEAIGEPVFLVPGEDMNIKITKPIDLLVAKAYIETLELNV